MSQATNPLIAVFTNGNGNVAISQLAFVTPAQAVTWAKRELKAAGAGAVFVENNVVTGHLTGRAPLGVSELTWTIYELSAVPAGALGASLGKNTFTIR